MGYSLNTGDHRYTVWVNRKNHRKVVATELYDHSKDPRENENVISKPEYAPVIRKLSILHREGWEGTRKALRGSLE